MQKKDKCEAAKLDRSLTLQCGLTFINVQQQAEFVWLVAMKP